MSNILTLAEWQKTIKPLNELIVQASSTDGRDAWRFWPIGMSWQYVYNFTKGEKIQIGNHDNIVLCAINSNNDRKRRPTGINRMKILNNLAENGIYNTYLNHNFYFDALPNYKFIISPEGNGIDCHRHYEALIAGCIPIMEKNKLTEEKYKGCPILWTSDYSEINENYLMEKYKEMLNEKYDFSCLFLSNYDIKMQTQIKNDGNYWVYKLATPKRNWYRV
jgi:hypothetical protein